MKRRMVMLNLVQSLALIWPLADGKTVVVMVNVPKLLADDPTMTTRLIFRDGLQLTPRGYQVRAGQLLTRLTEILNWKSCH